MIVFQGGFGIESKPWGVAVPTAFPCGFFIPENPFPISGFPERTDVAHPPLHLWPNLSD